MYIDIWFIFYLPEFLYLRRREDVPNLENVGKHKMNHISLYIIRREIWRWFRIWSQNLMFAYAFKRKSRFKNLRRRIQKFFCALNSHTNFDSKYVYMLILASSVTLESPTFKKSTFRNYVILRNRDAIKLQSREVGHMLNPMSQFNCVYHLPYLRYYALKF